MSFIKTVFQTFGAKVITIFINLVSGVIIARFLVPHDRGLYALLVNFPLLIGTITSLGLAPANLYFIKHKQSDASQVVSNALITALVIGFISCCLLLVSYEQVTSTLLKGVPWKLYMIMIVSCFIVLIDSYFMNILRGLEKFNIYNSRILFNSVITFLGSIIILVVLHRGLFELIFFTVLLTIFVNAWLVHTVNGFVPVRPAFDFALYKKTLSYGLKSYVQNIANALHYKVDIYMLAFYLRPEEVAYYTLAVGLVQILFHFPDSVGLVLLPKLIGKEKGDMHKFTALVSRNTIFVIFLPAVLMLITGKIIITFLYGTEYISASKAVPFLIPGIVIMCVFKVLARDYGARNRHQIIAIASAIGLAINITANVIMIPRMGITGAALSTTISYSVTSLIVLVCFLKETHLSLKQLLLISRYDFIIYRDKLVKSFSG